MHILIVEDHADSREQLERCLSRRDYDVTTAEDLRTGIDLLNMQQFDAIITDIALPDGTGYALISEVRRRGIGGARGHLELDIARNLLGHCVSLCRGAKPREGRAPVQV